jgi:Ni/Co efflux regulator RcnB
LADRRIPHAFTESPVDASGTGASPSVEQQELPMRTIILAALAAATTLTPMAASAQSNGEIRHDRREVRESRRDLEQARRYGDRDDRRDARQELREDRQELREDRQDRREGWRDYRRDNGNAFRRGAYRGPQGYRYRPVSIGYRFAPNYYSRPYWVDARAYRLNAPRFGYQRWVRYGNDVVLIDTRSGRVVQVYNRFFY